MPRAYLCVYHTSHSQKFFACFLPLFFSFCRTFHCFNELRLFLTMNPSHKFQMPHALGFSGFFFSIFGFWFRAMFAIECVWRQCEREREREVAFGRPLVASSTHVSLCLFKWADYLNSFDSLHQRIYSFSFSTFASPSLSPAVSLVFLIFVIIWWV